MNTQMKRRLFVVTGVIVIAVAVVLAIVASSTGYQTVSVAQALEPSQRETRIQVTGNVVDDSYTLEDDILSFAIYDPDGEPQAQLKVRYEGGLSATFGNQVTAICTGKINTDGVLECSELVTKCPSKYETATDALTVTQFLGYGENVIGKPVKVTGSVQPGSLKSLNQSERLVLLDEETGETLSVKYDGALSDAIEDKSLLVVTGALNNAGYLEASDIALRGD